MKRALFDGLVIAVTDGVRVVDNVRRRTSWPLPRRAFENRTPVWRVEIVDG